MSHIKDNPFTHGQLDKLLRAKMEGDTEFISGWTDRALKAYEATRHREIKFQEKAIKWEKLIDALMDIVDKNDVTNLEFGREK